jgi:hypothetical protein
MENNSKIAKILSKNDSLHHFPETSGEFFTSLIHDIADELGDGSSLTTLRLKAYNIARDRSHVYTDVLCHSGIVEMLVGLWQYNVYWSRTKLFQPLWLKKTLIGQHGAGAVRDTHFVFTQ